MRFGADKDKTLHEVGLFYVQDIAHVEKTHGHHAEVLECSEDDAH